MDVDIQIWIIHTHGGTLLELLDKVINNSIVRAISHELRVVEVLRIDNGINGEGLV